MLDTLKSLALKYTTPSGNLTVWMLPFTTLRAQPIYAAFEAIVPRTEWGAMHYAFVNFDTFVLDMKCGKDPSPIEMVFWLLWQHHDDELSTRWELYQQLYSDLFFTAFDLMWEATRDRTFDAPPELRKPAEDADPEQSPATSQPLAS